MNINWLCKFPCKMLGRYTFNTMILMSYIDTVQHYYKNIFLIILKLPRKPKSREINYLSILLIKG